MLAKILIAWCLVATTVMFHAAALGIMLNPVLRMTAQLETRFLSMTWLVARITWWLIVIHLVEIALWALFFWWQKCLPDAEASFYFSGVTYATIGYGDLVLPKEWRLFGPLEGLTGILLCGLSTAFLIATLSRMIARSHENQPKLICAKTLHRSRYGGSRQILRTRIYTYRLPQMR
jgi:hypothetical protein